ncbi:MAG: RNA polymerase factor sigma-54 [Nitrospirae bacterium]|nr:RNA polymerase factor sigma-54 [Nitrospirota bacterium]MCL5422333.1 RNA polymerase factor sigma-54 [Nitrospirota bacterium]
MALESRLELKLSQKLILTPQLQLAIKLLQMPQLELSQALTLELTENPFLDEVMEEREELSREEIENIETREEPDDTEAPLEKLIADLGGYGVEDYFDDRGSDGRDLGYFTPGTVEQPSFDQFASKEADLSDHLLWQLRLSDADEETREIGEIVIGNIDENGYLRVTDEEIAQTSGAEMEKVRAAVALVQGFDPPGIAARNLQECLLLQLRAVNLQGSLVEQIVLKNMADVEKKRYQQIARQYTVSLDTVMAAIRVIEGLEPKPARNFSNLPPTYVVPDVTVVKTEDGYQIILNDEGLPRLRLNSYYKKLFLAKNSLSKEEKQFIEEKLRSAVWLLKSLDQRNRTIYRVTESILNFQKDFFDTGIALLKPLNLRDVAASLGMHESTISRVTSNKFLSCSHGLFSFRFFFSSALQSGTGSVSSTSVKDLIRKIILEENNKKPLSDQRIVELLKTKNIVIARRTVAKYREELKIPPQGRRKTHD